MLYKFTFSGITIYKRKCGNDFIFISTYHLIKNAYFRPTFVYSRLQEPPLQVTK